MISFSNQIVESIAWTVMHSLWQCLLIAFVSAAIVVFAKNKNASFKYKVYCGALIAIVLSSLITFAHLSITNFDTIAEVSSVSNSNHLNISEAEDGSVLATAPSAYTIFDGIREYIDNHLPMIALIWIIGLLISILRLIGGISYVNYLKKAMNFPTDEHWVEVMNSYAQKLNVTKHIDLLESALVRSPIVIGHLKPIILFPIGFINKLDTNEVEAIISHELAHIMRNDYFVNILINVVESLYYYHPAVWWITAQAKEERENCCDDIAIELCGNKVVYAKSLVMVQEMAFTPGSLAMAFAGSGGPKSELAKRVLRILSPNRSKINTREKYSALSIVAILLVFISIAAKPNYKNKEENGLNLETFGNETFDYLKYDNEGKLDSLYLPNKIVDGEYTYKDDLQNVVLTIKNNYVIKFNINGLEVDGKDFSKFSKTIYKAIATRIKSHTEQQNDSQTTFLGNGEVVVKEGNQKSVLFIDEKGGNKLKIEVNNCVPVLFEYNNKKLYKDGKLASDQELNEMGWYIDNETGIQPIKGFTNIQPMEPLDEDSQKYLEDMKIYENDMKQHEADMKQHELDMIQHEKDMKQHELDMQQYKRDMEAYQNSMDELEKEGNNFSIEEVDEELKNRIIKFLKKQGYYSKGRLFFNLNYVNGMVNEKLINKNDHKNLLKMIEKHHGINFNKVDHIEFNLDIEGEEYSISQSTSKTSRTSKIKSSEMPLPPVPPNAEDLIEKAEISDSHNESDIQLGKKDLKFQQKIEAVFIKEGIMNKDNFSYFIVRGDIEINGKKVDSRIVKQVEEIYKNIFGKAMPPTFSKSKFQTNE